MIITVFSLSSGTTNRVTELRSEAQGASYPAGFEEVSSSPLYVNATNYNDNVVTGPTMFIQGSQNQRRPSKGDYPNSRTSPRIEDSVKPTGMQNVTQMVAQVSHLGARRESANAALSPRMYQPSDADQSDLRFQNSRESSPRIQHPAANTHYVNSGNAVEKSPSPVRRTNYGETNVMMHNVADANVARQRQLSPSYIPEQERPVCHVPPDTMFHGARPRTSVVNSVALEHSDIPSAQNQSRNQIPMRMTQSEVLLRENSPNRLTPPMARSVYDSQRTAEPLARTKSEGGSFDRSNRQEYQHMRSSSNPGRGVQANFERDYENVFDNVERKRPVDEHEDTSFYKDMDKPRPALPGTTLVMHENSENVSALKICPVCNLECSRLTMEQFQMHIVDCFDSTEEAPATLQPAAGNEDDRTCPMCNEAFPLTIPQETYEQHVLAHFGEEADMDRFEFVQP